MAEVGIIRKDGRLYIETPNILFPYKHITDPDAREKITSIRFEAGVTSIKSGQLDFVNVSSIKLPNTIQSAERMIFGTFGQVAHLVLPSDFWIVPDGMCMGARSLRSVKFKGIVYKLGGYCFADCTSLKIKLPNTLEEIEDSALKSVGNSTLVIPASVERIGRNACVSMPNLKRLVIEDPDHIDIDETAFAECDKLQHVILGRKKYNVFYENGMPRLVWLAEVIDGIVIQTVSAIGGSKTYRAHHGDIVEYGNDKAALVQTMRYALLRRADQQSDAKMISGQEFYCRMVAKDASNTPADDRLLRVACDECRQIQSRIYHECRRNCGLEREQG